jgi:uroporphyrinogen decarboxylase
MINPALIRKMWLEQTKEFIKPVKEKGIPVILHMDGDFSNIIDIMLEIEPGAIHPFEVCGNLDICKAKKMYGNKVTLIGNIDISGVLLSGTPEEVRDSVKEHIENLGKRGRYMCGSSHEISENIPVENFYALIESIYEFGKY